MYQHAYLWRINVSYPMWFTTVYQNEYIMRIKNTHFDSHYVFILVYSCKRSSRMMVMYPNNIFDKCFCTMSEIFMLVSHNYYMNNDVRINQVLIMYVPICPFYEELIYHC